MLGIMHFECLSYKYCKLNEGVIWRFLYWFHDTAYEPCTAKTGPEMFAFAIPKHIKVALSTVDISRFIILLVFYGTQLN